MEIPYTVWANLSIPESHVWSWENGPSCILRLHLMQCQIPSPPHAVPCPPSTSCCHALLHYLMQCHVPFPHLMLAVASKINRTATLLRFLAVGTCRS